MKIPTYQHIVKHHDRRRFAMDLLALFLALCFIVLVSLFVASHTGTDFLSHSVADSYTLQALAWREGKTTLSDAYPWLELAIYNGQYYVSFPPTPSVPMLLLSFFFGAETPNSLATFLYFLGSCAAAFYIAKRYVSRTHAAVLTVFVALGGSVLDIAVSGSGYSGAVWYQAQALSFLLTMLAFLWVESDRKSARFASLIAIALAVGCRPFQALYVPFLLWKLLLREMRPNVTATVKAMFFYVLIPSLIAAAYGAYNMARFGNPLEFGHRYLPEYTNSGDVVFGLSKVWQNLKQIFQPPRIVGGALAFSITGGFAVYLTNPMFLLGIGGMAERLIKRRVKADSLAIDAYDTSALDLHGAASRGVFIYEKAAGTNPFRKARHCDSPETERREPRVPRSPVFSAQDVAAQDAMLPDCMLLLMVLIHFASFLTHRTNGGWQYGTRYLVDVVPALLYLTARARKPVRLFEALAMGGLVVFNVYGTIAFHWV